ncbi:predicted protein [Verticillium alfalfae VaMs.102]|uniref:Predicted protein n=1 Tax=Verticillium alfalfae (strain VaMs.102 / ATCC MYA-4576 / FGSC 10136) TaxID=526221 RepID=C9SSC1_VERA1|nr:predicted protein [Verticillium alfalfae VaMs.102]EEY21686.1 predicted protein [Verticillium alfalfae VaMs.102]
MTLEQRKFSAVPDRLRPVSNVPLSDADRRPMTSKQAKKLHLERNRGPRLTKQQQRERDRELQAEIRREIAEKEKAERQEKDRVRQQAKAKVLRDKKKAKEDAEKDAKRKAGLPLATCRPSQDTIARFFKSNRVEKKTSISGLEKREHEEPVIPRWQAEEARPDPSQSHGEQQHVESLAAPTKVAKPQEPTEPKPSAVPSTKLVRLLAISEQEELTEKDNDADEEPSAAPLYTEPQEEAQLEVPRSPPKKRVRLDEGVGDQVCSPPLIIQRTPSPSRPSSPTISPARKEASQHDGQADVFTNTPALDCRAVGRTRLFSKVHDFGAEPALRGEAVHRAGSGGARKKQGPKQNRLTLVQADAGDAMPFFWGQDFNLSHQDMQEIEAPPVMAAKTARRDAPERMACQAEQAAPLIPMTWKRRRPVMQSFAAGRTRQSKVTTQKPQPGPNQRANARAPHNALEIRQTEPPAMVNPSETPAATGKRAPLRRVSNPPEAAQPPQHAVSSQDLAAMLEADWDDDCLQAQHRPQEQEAEPHKPRPELDEPQDLWDAISSQDLRAVFADEDWGNLAV